MECGSSVGFAFPDIPPLAHSWVHSLSQGCSFPCFSWAELRTQTLVPALPSLSGRLWMSPVNLPGGSLLYSSLLPAWAAWAAWAVGRRAICLEHLWRPIRFFCPPPPSLGASMVPVCLFTLVCCQPFLPGPWSCSLIQPILKYRQGHIISKLQVHNSL